MTAPDEFVDAYVECALWSSTDMNAEDGSDHNLEGLDVSEETMAEMRADCDAFYDDNEDDLAESELSDEQAGHDFWLTRNGHGAGFWDRGLGEVGERLSKASKPYGGVDLYVDENGEVRS